MLNDQELEYYFTKHQVTQAAQEYIEMVRNSAPSRLVGRNARNNVCTNFCSKKMGMTIQTESHTAEFLFAIEWEYDDSIIEFWDQPAPVSIKRTYKNGSKRAGSYTADFLLITTTGPCVVEVKTGKNINTLCEKKPVDWLMIDDEPHFIPAENIFRELDLPYSVLSSAQLNAIRAQNLKLLLASRSHNTPISIQFSHSVFALFKNQSWMKVSDLQNQLNLKDLTPIIKMIDQGELHIALDSQLLTETESTWISTSPELLAICIESTNNDLDLTNAHSISTDIAPTEKMATRALEALARIRSNESSRSVRRWKKQIIEGKKVGLTPFQSLLTKYHKSGNRKERINQICKDFMINFIHEHYASPTRLLPSRTYNLYADLAKIHHSKYPPVSPTCLRRYIALENNKKIAMGRGGKRAANASSSPSNVSDRAFKATHAFELASLDHHLVKQECIVVDAEGKRITARPWLTAMVDVYSKAVLAIWLSFRSPSKRSCSMAIRMCAKNHGRLPKSIIVDRGSDFQSVYFLSLLANFGIDHVIRPAGHSRYGSEIERFFGFYKVQWIAMRPGNLVSYKEHRGVSGSHSPKKNAQLSIHDTWSEIINYVNWKNDVPCGSELKSPVKKLQESLLKFPFVGVKVDYNLDFIIQSAVDAGEYSISESRGININGTHYWSSSLAACAKSRKKVEVRFEPENPYLIYAQTNNSWTPCYATKNQEFATKDPVLRLAHASQVLDCNAIRVQFKKECMGELVKDMITRDKSRAVNKENTLPREHPSTLNPNSDNEPDLFKEIENTSNNTITYSSWRK